TLTMKEFLTYLTGFTIFCLVISFMIGKLRLLALVWLYHSQRRHTSEPAMGISVVICTRNDLKSLQHNLPFVLKQDHPEFEVIVVDDASSDGTEAYLRTLSQQEPRLRYTRITEKISPGKKQALQTGIQMATYSFVLLTDADCMPASAQWISSHAALRSGQR